MKKCVFRVKEGYTQLYTIICHKCRDTFPTIADWERHAEIHIKTKRKKK